MLLRAEQLTKRFGPLTALHGLSFDLHPGEVLGLTGRSGSGKSVVAHLLGGSFRPDEGTLYVEDRRVRWPLEPRAHGIEVVYQRPALVDTLDIASNIFLGQERSWPGRGWFALPQRRRMDRECEEILGRLETPLPPRERIANLTSEQRQIVALARTLARPSRIIVIDDPTALLGYAMQRRLLSLIEEWRQEGKGVLFCTYNLDHMFEVSDRIVVLREGHHAATLETARTTREEVVDAIVGTDTREVTPVMWALESYYSARQQADELRSQQQHLQEDLAARDALNQRLIEQLAQQVSALDSANMALQEAQRRLMTEREDERKRLARELHDQVIQDLLSVNYELEGLAGDAPEALAEELGDVRSSIRQLVEDVRRICGNLRPPTIDSLGLGAALQSLVRDWRSRSGIDVTLNVDKQLGRLPEALELSIFRIVQEGLNNVRRHAEASSVVITLGMPLPRTLLLTIADDGRGMPPGVDLARAAAQGHYGLLGISERVALLGGRLSLQNGPGGGVLLQVELPYQPGRTDS